MRKILILSSNPRRDLNLEREAGDLIKAVQRLGNFDVRIALAVRPQELQELFLEYKPQIVHFCGHGAGEQGLVLQDDDGRERLVSTESLAELFKIFSDRIDCAVLNACDSDHQSKAIVAYIVAYIDYAIGMSEEILDKAAYIFAVGFYQGLGYGESIDRAYELGCNAIQLQLLNASTSRSEGSRIDRKLIPVSIAPTTSLAEHLKPILRKKSALSSAETVPPASTPSHLPPDFARTIKQEVDRKDYKDQARETWDRFGQVPPNTVSPLSQQEYRQRKVLLGKVKEFWIEGFLMQSLYADTAINLDLKARPDAVRRPFQEVQNLLVELDESFEKLQSTDIHNEIGQGKTLLILGEPGAGKTIALLQLAQRLVAQTEQDLTQSIPVVFNLSSWAKRQKSIEDWLIEELREKYQVPKALAEPWIKQEQLVLLLDGLDEVKAEHRNACVRALNQFICLHGCTEIVVCSRIKDYEALTDRLQLSSALCIQPLSTERVYQFLEDAGDSLTGLKTLLQQDEELEQFAQTPLILNIMGIAYHGQPVEVLLQEIGSTEDRYQHLFDTYIERMLGRRGSSSEYPKKKVLRWLSWLAKRMVQESQTAFLIEKMQPTWLQNQAERRIYQIRICLVFGLIGGLMFGLAVGLMFGLIGGLMFGLMFGLIGGLMFGLIFGLSFEREREIKLIEQLSWSWQRAKHRSMVKLIIGLIFGLIAGLIIGLICGGELIFGLSGLISTLFIELIIGLIGGGLIGTEVEQRTVPNQGIWNSARNYVVLMLIFGLVGGLIFGLMGGLSLGLMGGLSLGLTSGLFSGLFGALLYGGTACIQHFNLRLMLHSRRRIPWNYARFLDYASERLLLKKVGGGYLFFHRMLMEHFARMEPD